MERETTVEKGEKKYSPGHISGRTLRMPALKVTDYYLFKEARSLFEYDMRQLFTLGLRLIYVCLHDKNMRDKVFSLANEIKGEDLDKTVEGVKYTAFKDIISS